MNWTIIVITAIGAMVAIAEAARAIDKIRMMLTWGNGANLVDAVVAICATAIAITAIYLSWRLL
jgi:hypothetical protein